MSMRGYKPLAQGPDQDALVETEQGEQPTEKGHDDGPLIRHLGDLPDGHDDPNTPIDVDSISTDRSGTMMSFEMDLGEPLVVETPMSRFRHTLHSKRALFAVGSAVVLLAITVFSSTTMMTNDSAVTAVPLRRKLTQLVQSRLPATSFGSPTAPESKALEWMVTVDKLNHTTVSDDRLVQRFAMAAVSFALDIPGDDEWMTEKSECLWKAHGHPLFVCEGDDDNNNNDRVVGLKWHKHLPTNSSLPMTIGLLSDLTDVTIETHSLVGSIPSEIGLLTKLTSLSIFNNNLTGSLPSEIGLLTGLVYLELFDNVGLTGPIPSEVGLLASLTDLHFTDNNFTGPIPSELGLLTGLTSLTLFNNSLVGPIPPEIGLLVDMTDLRLHDNDLSSSIPSEIASLTSLGHLKIYNTDLTGSLPESFCDHFFTALVDCDKVKCSCCKDIDWNECPLN